VNVGDTLAGKYQVERVLGTGGMGVVVAAKHLTLGERVAIKFLLPDALTKPDVVARFLREGQAAARLKSEHVARVHDVGKLENGAPFLVMEYLDGKDLGQVLRAEGTLAIDVAVDYVLQACEALAEAHAAGIIHRDLKPSNLFVVLRNDGTPSVKLIDFGISKVQLPGAEGGEGEMTATAVMMGSPYYMAPEQMANARDVDVRADVWSLGVLLHLLVTGKLPFRAPSVMEVFERILKGAPPLRTLRPEAPEALEAAVLRCLKRERGERFADVAELAAAIAPFGGPEAASSEARVRRILASRASRQSWTAASASEAVPVAAVTPAPVAHPTPSSGPPSSSPSSIPSLPSSSGSPSSSPSVPSVSSMSPAPKPPTDPPTGGPWDQKTGSAPRTSRPRALVAVLALVAVGGPVAFFATRGDAPKADSTVEAAKVEAARVEAAKVVDTAPAQAATSAPSATVAPGPTVTVASSVTATPSSVPSATPATARKQASTPSPPPAARPPRPKSGDDLFGTQK
jgi:serine/threonine-protein kinase